MIIPEAEWNELIEESNIHLIVKVLWNQSKIKVSLSLLSLTVLLQ